MYCVMWASVCIMLACSCARRHRRAWSAHARSAARACAFMISVHTYYVLSPPPGVGNFKNCDGITGLFSFRQGCVWRKTEWHGELDCAKSRVATPTARALNARCGCGYARLVPTHAQQFRDEVTARRCIEASLSLDLGGKNYGLWRILFLSVAQLWRQFRQLPTPVHAYVLFFFSPPVLIPSLAILCSRI